MKKIILVGMTAGALALSGCASRPTESEVTGRAQTTKNGPSIEAQQVAAEQESSFVAELTFAKNGSNLSSAGKESLRQLVRSAKQAGAIEEIKIITWSDSEYPSVHTKKLSSAERDLVSKRNKGIADHLKTLENDLKVTPYSMAERPSVLAEIGGTSDARIKRSLEMAGIPTTDTTVKVPAKASKSIVLVVVNPHKTN